MGWHVSENDDGRGSSGDGSGDISHLAECLYQHVGEDHDACCPKDHNAFQQSQRQLVERWLGDDEPQREKGDTEEMPE